MSEATLSKTDFIRQVLNEIGAINVDPPKGWHEEVRNRFVDQKMDVPHDMTIYGVRAREMEKAGLKPLTQSERRRKKNKYANSPHVSSKASSKNVASSNGKHSASPKPVFAKQNSKHLVNGSQLTALIKMINEFGGVDNFIEVVKSLKYLKS